MELLGQIGSAGAGPLDLSGLLNEKPEFLAEVLKVAAESARGSDAPVPNLQWLSDPANAPRVAEIAVIFPLPEGLVAVKAAGTLTDPEARV